MNAPAGPARWDRAVVIYTPMTRRLFAKDWHEIRRSIIRHADIAAEVETVSSECVGQALRQYQPDLIIAAGGDGTVNLCIQVMTENDLLAVVPLGTANDLHRSLGKPSALTHRIDRIEVNDRPFCTTGGLGIPSTVSQQVNRLRQSGSGRLSRAIGHQIYPVVAAKLLLLGSALSRSVEIEWVDADSGTTNHMRLRTNTLFVANQSTFAGSLMVARDSVNDDGHFEICIFKNQNYWRDLMITARIAMALDQRKRDCRVLRALSARITTTEPVPFFGDGEIIEINRHFDLNIRPKALNLANLDWRLGAQDSRKESRHP